MNKYLLIILECIVFFVIPLIFGWGIYWLGRYHGQCEGRQEILNEINNP